MVSRSDREGLTVDGARGGTVKHPANAIFNAACTTVRQMLPLFGLSPAARLALPTTFEEPESDFDKWVRDYAVDESRGLDLAN